MECLWLSHHTFKHLVQNGETFRNETAPLLLRNMQECIVLCNYFNWSKQTKWLAILCVKNKFHNINVFLVELFYKSNIILSMFSEYHHDIWKTCVDCFGDFGEFAASHLFALSFRLQSKSKHSHTTTPAAGILNPLCLIHGNTLLNQALDHGADAAWSRPSGNCAYELQVRWPWGPWKCLTQIK